MPRFINLFALLSFAVDHQIVERREGINAAVSTEVVDVFKGKTPGQLQALYAQIQKRIHSKEEGLDVREYFSCLFACLQILLPCVIFSSLYPG